nr:MAG TPA: hypothetical protein [Caudoviricetes sp.]
MRRLTYSRTKFLFFVHRLMGPTICTYLRIYLSTAQSCK